MLKARRFVLLALVVLLGLSSSIAMAEKPDKTEPTADVVPPGVTGVPFSSSKPSEGTETDPTGVSTLSFGTICTGYVYSWMATTGEYPGLVLRSDAPLAGCVETSLILGSARVYNKDGVVIKEYPDIAYVPGSSWSETMSIPDGESYETLTVAWTMRFFWSDGTYSSWHYPGSSAWLPRQFSSQTLLNEHFTKHQYEYMVFTHRAYVDIVNSIIAGQTEKKTRSNGDICYWNDPMKSIAITKDSDRFLKTGFKPTNGYIYFTMGADCS